MMPSLMGGLGMPGHVLQAFPTAPILDEFSRQQPLSETTRRVSRGSSNAYRPTSAMRVVKPNSTSNSPQTSMQRRRTLMNDGNLARRRQYALDQAILNQQVPGVASPFDGYSEPMKTTSRPVSWHPSSHIQHPQMQLQQLPQFDMSQYMMPTTTPYSEADIYARYNQLPPTPAVYSSHTSPISSFSPLSLPMATSPQQPPLPQCIPMDTWNAPAYIDSAPYPTSRSPGTTEPFPSYTGQPELSWETFANNGFNSCTAPPTPDNYQLASPPQANVPSEESIPYQALDESEEEGEILVGMGLYDTPDKSELDPELDHYRTTTSHLLGSTYRKGAGLKLEEAWAPPKDDEEAEDDDDAEGEDQGEDQGEEKEQEKESTAQQTTNAQQNWI
ncbi:hypothetical protein JX265_011856 [Neoarthrinium moseri]|uniref:Uncharacterized protein n=1 Tax=Neoarthrinium moseri TaxID=1658444 RepID=A0A9P9WBC3_9PEZI|nr:uncharacterized protein JN550_010375 [Neoarthrinium moseri]KAI1847181.1 hypothetical protein JX266_006721 [Neoarthrinium moseri]KAI1856141.1 hypothetical protein JX265_011856 [Neoarthrinium moseri]KAI1862219.1 hypothetical protein JN550_010375 [Neoarthrinium moseri]